MINNFNRVIKAVRVYAEKYTNMALVPQRITAITTDLDETILKLPKGPVNSIVSLTRIRNGVETPYSNYTTIDPYQIELRPYWTGTLSEGWHTYFYRIVYEAGNLEAIPDDMKLGMLKMIKTCYEDRGNFVKGTIVSKLMESAELFLSPYREVSLNG